MPDFLVFSALIPKIMGAKLILDIHDPMPEMFLSKYSGHENRFLLKFIYWQERISCAVVDAVITANSNFKANLVTRGIPAKKITVVNNFPNSVIFDRKAIKRQRLSPKKTFTLIYPGTIAPRYGLDIAIRALPELKARIPGIHLVVIGPESDCKNELIRLVELLDVAECVRFKTVVPHEEIPRAVAEADVGIYPARKDSHMNIATPTKLLEYVMMGIPVISSRLDIIESFFDESSVLFFESDNVAQFVGCVLRLYEDPALRRELVRNADRIFVETHSWDREFHLYWGVLKGLLPSGILDRGFYGA